MTKEQLEVIVGLFAGVGAAIVQIVVSIDGKSAVSALEIALAMRVRADALAPQTRNREQIGLVLRRLAAEIEGETPEGFLGERLLN